MLHVPAPLVRIWMGDWRSRMWTYELKEYIEGKLNRKKSNTESSHCIYQ